MAESILACSACLRRAIQLLPQQRVVLERRIVHQALLARPFPQPYRRYASFATGITQTTEQEPANDQNQPKDEVQAVSQDQAREKRKIEYAVNKQLSLIDDPFHIAETVEGILAKGRYEEALLLTQKASKDYQVTVAWNRLIDYKFKNQQLRDAIKLYNDMKKRAQLPNVQTYTVIFRGCARSEHPKLAVSEAVKLYHNLLRNDRLEANIIHLNAVMNVCARAGDIDSMFSLLDTANESTRAPEAFTYTVILNALRNTTLKENNELDPEQQRENLEKMVYRVKALWEEVITKWRKGRLVIDEDLVCAMGRVLYASPKREEKREIFDLISQTMNIPNFSKPEPETPVESEVKTPARTPRRGVTYATPDKNTLSLLLQAVTGARLTTCGVKYWNLLIRKYSVAPDRDNFMRMFGMLKVAKASGFATELLDHIPDEINNDRIYKMAMETCVRDNINHNAIKHSNQILDKMIDRLEIPHPHVLRLYMRVSLVSHYAFRTKAKDGDETGAKRDYGIQITEALARMWEPYQKLHQHYFKEVNPTTAEEKAVLYNDQREVIALARLMYSSFSKVIEERMLPEEDIREMRPIGAKINRTIQKFFTNRDEIEPNIKSKAKHDMQDFENPAGGDFVWDTSKTNDRLSWRSEWRHGPRDGGSGEGQEGGAYERQERPRRQERHRGRRENVGERRGRYSGSSEWKTPRNERTSYNPGRREREQIRNEREGNPENRPSSRRGATSSGSSNVQW
ncbi:Fc.00g076180.m01.CDS01 [Cosmosporella sp. VM-42]